MLKLIRKFMTNWLLPLLVVILCPHTVSAQQGYQTIIDQPLAVLDTDDDLKQIAWHPDGQFLAVASDDGVKIYTDTLELITAILPGELIYSLSWNPDGEQLALTNGSNLEIWGWSPSTQMLSLVTTLQSTSTQISVAWSPKSSRLASIGAVNYPNDFLEGHALVWSISDWHLEYQFTDLYLIPSNESLSPGHILTWNPINENNIAFLAYLLAPNGDSVASDISVFVGDLNTKTTKQQILLNPGLQGLSLAWQPSGDLIATTNDYGIDLYTLNGDFAGSFAMGGMTYAVDWSPNGRYVTGNTGIGDVTNGYMLGYLWYHTPRSVGWNPDGIRLAIAHYDGIIRIEDASLLPSFVPPNDSDDAQPTPTTS